MNLVHCCGHAHTETNIKSGIHFKWTFPRFGLQLSYKLFKLVKKCNVVISAIF